MTEIGGVAAALLGSVLGGTAIAGTRFVVGAIDPLNVAMLRYGIGALLLLPFAARALPKLEGAADLARTLALGLLFFALYPYAFALALAHTTAVRGALALSSMPLLTLAFAVLLRREPFTWRGAIGISLAVAGLAFALSPRLGGAAAGAWKGDLIMVAAAAMQSVYNVLSRPYIVRIGALPFTSFGMLVGALTLLVVCLLTGKVSELHGLQSVEWGAIVYLGVFGGAVLWVLWAIGLRFARPSMVALTNTVNTLTASFLGAMLLGETVGPAFVIGFIAVIAGIAIALKRP